MSNHSGQRETLDSVARAAVAVMVAAAFFSCAQQTPHRGKQYFHDSVTFGDAVTMNGALATSGNISVTGNLTATGDISATGSVTAGDISATGSVTATTGLVSPHSYASSGVIAAGKVVMKNESSVVVVANAQSRFSVNFVGVAASAASGNVVSVYDLPGSRFAISGTSANKTYYLSTSDGALVEQASIATHLMGTIGRKVRVGYTDNANYFILAPYVEDESPASASIDFDFKDGQIVAKRGSILDFNRNSVATYFQNGTLKFAGVDSPRVESDSSGNNLGLVIEPAGTNRLIQNRDMSNAAWTKTNMTAARSQVGIDGLASHATLLTATAGDAVAEQNADSATLDGAVTCGSVYMKRSSGSGVISISNNSIDYTDITAQINSSTFSRVQINSTPVTAIFAIKIATSADAVIVDFAQQELCTDASGKASSAIWTEAAAITRAAEQLIIAHAPIGGSHSLYVQARFDSVQDLPDHAGIFLYNSGSSVSGLQIPDTASDDLRIRQHAGTNGATHADALSVGVFEHYMGIVAALESATAYDLTDAVSTTAAVTVAAGQMLDSGGGFSIGYNSSAVAPYMHVKRAMVFDKALSAAERAYVIQ